MSKHLGDWTSSRSVVNWHLLWRRVHFLLKRTKEELKSVLCGNTCTDPVVNELSREDMVDGW